jgi:hypothetical protein
VNDLLEVVLNTLTDKVERVVFACPKEVSWVACVRLIDEEGVIVRTGPSAEGPHHRAEIEEDVTTSQIMKDVLVHLGIASSVAVHLSFGQRPPMALITSLPCERGSRR